METKKSPPLEGDWQELDPSLHDRDDYADSGGGDSGGAGGGDDGGGNNGEGGSGDGSGDDWAWWDTALAIFAIAVGVGLIVAAVLYYH